MKCNDAQTLINLLYDGALEAKDTALVHDHLQLCSECEREWHGLEQLRSSFNEAKCKNQMPPGLMEKISQRLKEEERIASKKLAVNYTGTLATAFVATILVLLGIFLSPTWMNKPTAPIALQTASAETLVTDLQSEGTLKSVADPNELIRRLGFEIKHVRLPEWQISNSGIYQARAAMPIARFDFVRKEGANYQHLSCYQAPQGVIQAQNASLRIIDGKSVRFGHQGKFQFALWTQHGRDYLFVTSLPIPQLEEIVKNA